MYRTSFMLAPLALLIIAGLLLGGGLAIHQAGWSEGFRAAQLAASASAPMPVYTGFDGWGLLIALGAGLLLLLMVGKLVKMWMWTSVWRHWPTPNGPDNERPKWWADRMAAHRHHTHPPIPPWCAGWQRPTAEESAGPASATQVARDPAPSQPS